MSKVDKLRQLEKNRSRLSGILSTRRSNADRVKSMADNLLKEKYGTTGSSNRLFQNCKNCAIDRVNCETPQGAMLHNSSFDCGFGMPSPSQAAAIQHSISVDVDHGNNLLMSNSHRHQMSARPPFKT